MRRPLPFDALLKRIPYTRIRAVVVTVMTAALGVGALIGDALIPHGYTEWPLYLLPAIYIGLLRSSRLQIAAGLLCALMLILGTVFLEHWDAGVVIVHRLMGLAMIGFVTLILVVNHRAYHRGQRFARERQQGEEALRQSENRLQLLNENLEELVVARTEEVRELAKALTLAEQRERQRLSLLLHEDLQQILFSAQLRIGMLQRCGQGLTPTADEDVGELKRLTAKAIETSKVLSVELNPPILRGEGLDAALRWMAQHFQNRYGLSVTLSIAEPFSQIDLERRILLVQFVRELLMNVARHAGTSQATLAVERREGAIQITVSDQGRGFDLARLRSQHQHREYFGLFGIQERLRLLGGRLEIESTPYTGTRGRLILPLPELKGAESVCPEES